MQTFQIKRRLAPILFTLYLMPSLTGCISKDKICSWVCENYALNNDSDSSLDDDIEFGQDYVILNPEHQVLNKNFFEQLHENIPTIYDGDHHGEQVIDNVFDLKFTKQESGSGKVYFSTRNRPYDDASSSIFANLVTDHSGDSKFLKVTRFELTGDSVISVFWKDLSLYENQDMFKSLIVLTSCKEENRCEFPYHTGILKMDCGVHDCYFVDEMKQNPEFSSLDGVKNYGEFVTSFEKVRKQSSKN